MKFLALTVFTLTITTHAAMAQRPSGDDSAWTLDVGAGVMVAPEYEGGDEHEVKALPYLDLKYKDIARLNRDGVRLNVLRGEALTIGAGVGADFGRDADDADRLNGLGDVDPTAELRLYADYTHKNITTSATFGHDLGDGHDGAYVTFGSSYRIMLPHYQTMLIPAIKTTYASGDYMQSYFGVNDNQAARSGLARYDADSGFKDASASLLLSHSLTPNISLNTVASYKRLLGDAADSPISADNDQLSLGAFLSYRFTFAQ